MSINEAVIRGAELRLRPVVMTSLTAVLGLLPAALANSIGSQAQKPLAIVVVGGMLVNMLLTQFLMPVLYTYFPGLSGVAGPCLRAGRRARISSTPSCPELGRKRRSEAMTTAGTQPARHASPDPPSTPGPGPADRPAGRTCGGS